MGALRFPVRRWLWAGRLRGKKGQPVAKGAVRAHYEPPRSRDRRRYDARIRHLTLVLPPQYAARLFDAQDTGVSERQLRGIAAEGPGEVYFRDGSRRAHGLEVEFTDAEHLEFDL